MPKQVTRNVALTRQLDRFVKQKLDSGRYQSVSEVVREGLRLLEERDEWRKAKLQGMREQVEIGWQQSMRGEVVDGPRVFEEIRQLSKSRRSKMKARR